MNFLFIFDGIRYILLYLCTSGVSHCALPSIIFTRIYELDWMIYNTAELACCHLVNESTS